MRRAMVSSQSFRQLVSFHCMAAGIRHSAPQAEFEATVLARAGQHAISSIEMLRGYHRLPYDIKSKILSGLLITSSEFRHEASKALFEDCLKSVNGAFQSLIQALA